MAFPSRRLKRVFSRTVPILAVLVMLLAALYLVSDVERGTAGFGRHYLWVLGLTGVALLVLLVTITLRIVNLVQRVRRSAPGARLAARLVRIFLTLALPPALLVYVFSIEFLGETVDGWFDVEVEQALADSLELGQQFLDTRTLEVRNQMLRLAEQLENVPEERLFGELLQRVSSRGPESLTVFSRTGGVIANADIRSTSAGPDRPGDFALLQASEQGEYAAAEPAGPGQLKVRVIERLSMAVPGADVRLLQAIYPLPANFTQLAENIAQEYSDYQNAAYLRSSLKQSFILILSLVLLLTVLLAILAAINAAKRLVKPISQLAQGTRAVAGGDFDRQIEVPGRDELGFLVQSFNQMTRQLRQASHEAEESRALLQTQREYLETVLARLSAGVIATDARGRLVTANESASSILATPLNEHRGEALTDLGDAQPALTPLLTVVQEEIDRASRNWRREIKLDRDGHSMVLVCRGSSLPSADRDGAGHVVIFDDVTILDQAQREAAWAEVARRLAHEVKNPLTPIQLAAERLRHKLLNELDEADALILDRATRTIVAQVDALKALVNAFGDYAQEPRLAALPLDLHELVGDVAELYRSPEKPLQVELDLGARDTRIRADAVRLRQLLHNLIRNAMEASDDEAAMVTVTLGTDNPVVGEGQWIRLAVKDDGPGFAESVAEHPFEPYVTSKPRGTGLGLAICRKIVEEHGGRIEAGNHPEGGAVISVLLPLEAGQQGELAGQQDSQRAAG